MLYKNFILVDTQVTKAGVATKVEMQMPGEVIAKRVILNRPFVYAIVDNETKLSLFIGTMMNREE